jgi:hypothetical protein
MSGDPCYSRYSSARRKLDVVYYYVVFTATG